MHLTEAPCAAGLIALLALSACSGGADGAPPSPPPVPLGIISTDLQARARLALLRFDNESNDAATESSAAPGPPRIAGGPRPAAVSQGVALVESVR